MMFNCYFCDGVFCLPKVTLDEIYLQGANLEDATLFGSSLASANFKGAFMRRVSLGEAYLEAAELKDVDFGEESASVDECTQLPRTVDHRPGFSTDIKGYFKVDLENGKIYNR